MRVNKNDQNDAEGLADGDEVIGACNHRIAHQWRKVIDELDAQRAGQGALTNVSTSMGDYQYRSDENFQTAVPGLIHSVRKPSGNSRGSGGGRRPSGWA